MILQQYPPSLDLEYCSFTAIFSSVNKELLYLVLKFSRLLYCTPVLYAAVSADLFLLLSDASFVFVFVVPVLMFFLFPCFGCLLDYIQYSVLRPYMFLFGCYTHQVHYFQSCACDSIVWSGTEQITASNGISQIQKKNATQKYSGTNNNIKHTHRRYTEQITFQSSHSTFLLFSHKQENCEKEGQRESEKKQKV